MKKALMISLLLVLLTACGAEQKFVAMPPNLDKEHVPHQTIEMTAKRYDFTPEEIHVKAGTLLTLKITALDGTHGFGIDEFGISERLEEKEQKVIEFYVPEKGIYTFHCTHLCGIGHLGMKGKLIVE